MSVFSGWIIKSSQNKDKLLQRATFREKKPKTNFIFRYDFWKCFTFSLQKSSSSARVGLIHNPAITRTDDQPEALQIARTVEAVLASKSHVTPAMLTFMEKLLDESNDFEKLSSDFKAMDAILAKASVCSYNTEKGVFFIELLLLKSYFVKFLTHSAVLSW